MSSFSQHPWQLASLTRPLCKSYKTAAAILIWTSVTSTHSMEIKIAFAKKISSFLVFINAPAVLNMPFLSCLEVSKWKQHRDASCGQNSTDKNGTSLITTRLLWAHHLSKYQLTHRNKKIINPRSNQLCIYCFSFFFFPPPLTTSSEGVTISHRSTRDKWLYILTYVITLYITTFHCMNWQSLKSQHIIKSSICNQYLAQ